MFTQSCTLEASTVNEHETGSSVDESGTKAVVVTFWLSFSKSLSSLFCVLVLDDSADFLCLLLFFSVDEALVLLVYKKKEK